MSTICRTCIWWRAEPPTALGKRVGAEFGECRRHAPRLKMSRHSDETESVWPPTLADDWCGEFKPDLQTRIPLEASNG